MSTKAEISRRNGAKSKGPISIEGRRRASLNALKHGLASSKPHNLCLKNEIPQTLDELVARWTARLQPRDPAELELVHEIAAHRWRMHRSWAIETAALDTQMDRQSAKVSEDYRIIDEPTRTAEAFKSLADNSISLEVLGRYEYRLRRQFERALSDYLRLRAAEFLPNESTIPSSS